MDLIVFEKYLLPNVDARALSRLYMIPRWNPDRASICDAPLVLNDPMTSWLNRLRSPVMSAVINELAELLLNDILEIDSFSAVLNSNTFPCRC